MFIDFRERKGQREGEKHQLFASHMNTDWESNAQPLVLQDNAPTNWATPARALIGLL